jgi:Mn-dependent DtxR family transcriptional regulator
VLKLTLTGRRKEFLTAIQETYAATGEPLHYEDIARLLGVSKWTAYDMVRELAKQGLVSIEYTTNQSEKQVGRSRLAIRPAVASSFFISLPEESARVLEMIRTCEPGATKEHFQVFMQRATASDSKGMFCFYLVAALVLLSNRLIRSGGLLSILESLLVFSSSELGLVAAAGMVVALIIRGGVHPEMVNHLQESVACFHEYIGEITEEERTKITGFWQKALNINLAEI